MRSMTLQNQRCQVVSFSEDCTATHMSIPVAMATRLTVINRLQRTFDRGIIIVLPSTRRGGQADSRGHLHTVHNNLHLGRLRHVLFGVAHHILNCRVPVACCC